MNDFNHWITALQGKPASAPDSPSLAYQEGLLIRNLVLECAQERQEKQWDKVLEEARRKGLLEANLDKENNSLLIPIQPSHPNLPSRFRDWAASNEPRFLWAASVAVLLAMGTYLWIQKTENPSAVNTSNPFSHEGLQNMRGGSQSVQFIRVPKGETPQTMTPKIDAIFNHYGIKYYDPFYTKDGRVQFIAMIPTSTYPSIDIDTDLKKIGIKLVIEKKEDSKEDGFVNFVLIPDK